MTFHAKGVSLHVFLLQGVRLYKQSDFNLPLVMGHTIFYAKRDPPPLLF